MQPNAGLPELVNGATHYPLGAAEMASWVERFVLEDGLNLVGGCCGTSMPAYRGAGRDVAQAWATARPAPAFSAATIGCRRSPACMGRRRCGRRTATSPSASAATPMAAKKWRELQERGDWDGCVAVGREQVGERHPTAWTSAPPSSGRDEVYGDEPGDHPLHLQRERAAGDRQHRNERDRPRR